MKFLCPNYEKYFTIKEVEVLFDAVCSSSRGNFTKFYDSRSAAKSPFFCSYHAPLNKAGNKIIHGQKFRPRDGYYHCSLADACDLATIVISKCPKKCSYCDQVASHYCQSCESTAEPYLCKTCWNEHLNCRYTRTHEPRQI